MWVIEIGGFFVVVCILDMMLLVVSKLVVWLE